MGNRVASMECWTAPRAGNAACAPPPRPHPPPVLARRMKRHAASGGVDQGGNKALAEGIKGSSRGGMESTIMKRPRRVEGRGRGGARDLVENERSAAATPRGERAAETQEHGRRWRRDQLDAHVV